MFKKAMLICITALALALSACTALPGGGTGTGISFGAESPAQAIFAVKSGYATALKAAVAYKELLKCSEVLKIVCSDPKVVAQIQKADLVAFQAISTAQAAADTLGGPAAQSAVGAARAALTALTTLISTGAR